MEFEVKAPILGFENVKRMKLEKIDDLFMRLKNCDEETPSFTLVNPFMLRDYQFETPIAFKVLLDIKDETNYLILNIMILHKPLENSSVNFIAPLVFNFDNNTMGQVVLDSTKFPDYGLAETISKYIYNEEETQQNNNENS